ncbi:unnamed protein product [Dicrocoelium dendriticum]|nr:unnamed protein product [Dicrocoelium dendriticum]
MLRLMDDHAMLLYERKYIGTPNVLDANANINRDNFPLFRAILCGALFPNILRLVPKSKGEKVTQPRVLARPSEGKISVCSRSVNGNVCPVDPVWMVYYNKTQLDNMSCPLALDTTIIPLRPILFFAGMIRPKPNSNFFEVDGWIDIQAPTELIRTIEDLRTCLDSILKSKFRNPGVTDWDQSSVEGRVLQTIIDLLVSEKVTEIQTKRYPWEKNDLRMMPDEAKGNVTRINSPAPPNLSS